MVGVDGNGQAVAHYVASGRPTSVYEAFRQGSVMSLQRGIGSQKGMNWELLHSERAIGSVITNCRVGMLSVTEPALIVDGEAMYVVLKKWLRMK